MSFTFKCPHCGQEIHGEEAWIGQQAACPTCLQTITVLRPDMEAPPPPMHEMFQQDEQQPQTIYNEPDSPPKKFNSHLWLAIVSTIFGCTIAGVIALVFAMKAQDDYRKGHYASAELRAKNAQTIAILNLAYPFIASIVAWLYSYYGLMY